MNKNLKEKIDEMKVLMMDLYRLAGTVDSIVTQIEDEHNFPISEYDNGEFYYMFAKSQTAYLRDVIKAKEYDQTISKLETAIEEILKLKP